MKNFQGIFFHWLPLASVIVLLSGLVYVAVQQNYRQSLNDPQVQIVGDAVAALEGGRNPVEAVPREIIDANKSLAPFIAIYDKSGTPLEASATVDGQSLKPPVGVLDYARANGENRVTWAAEP